MMSLTDPPSLGFSRMWSVSICFSLGPSGSSNPLHSCPPPPHTSPPGLLRPPAGQQPVRLSGGFAAFRLGPAASWLSGWKPLWLSGSECLHAGKKKHHQDNFLYSPFLLSFLPLHGGDMWDSRFLFKHSSWRLCASWWSINVIRRN